MILCHSGVAESRHAGKGGLGMTYIDVVVLGLVLGICETLPVSGSGHLAMLRHFFGYSAVLEDHLAVLAFIRLGIMAAVIAGCWPVCKDLARVFFSAFDTNRAVRESGRAARRLLLLLALATLPLFLLLAVQSRVQTLYENPFFIGFAFLASGLLLFGANRVRRGGKTGKNATLWDALAVGFVQLLAILPGFSRTGAGIAAGLHRRFDREFAVQFSLLLYLPAGLGASILTLARAGGFDWHFLLKYALAFLTAGLAAYGSIRLLNYIAKRGSFGGFCYYCWGAGLVTLVLSLVA